MTELRSLKNAKGLDAFKSFSSFTLNTPNILTYRACNKDHKYIFKETLQNIMEDGHIICFFILLQLAH
jgi:hypothetical protein